MPAAAASVVSFPMGKRPYPALLAVSDLHVHYDVNRRLVEGLCPGHPDDWLLVAGDVSESVVDIERALRTLRNRFACVVWVPGNHELWTGRHEDPQIRGVARYEQLVAMCRRLGVLTPEDPYPVWSGPGGPVRVAPLFLLYDYSFLPAGVTTAAEALARAWQAGVVCADEFLLFPDPYQTRAEWCADRVAVTERRLAEHRDGVPLVLVSHWPLIREPTRTLRHQEFALWCGTTSTADWHRTFDVAAAVYGHLHIPRRAIYDAVPFAEVSLGYPREWQRFGLRDDLARQILPAGP
jgi:3',5'-cyclic AMP phosphodiesterase CpdA